MKAPELHYHTCSNRRLPKISHVQGSLVFLSRVPFSLILFVTMQYQTIGSHHFPELVNSGQDRSVFWAPNPAHQRAFLQVMFVHKSNDECSELLIAHMQYFLFSFEFNNATLFRWILA